MPLKIEGQCGECGYYMMFDLQRNFYCVNRSCPQYNKLFKAPTVEVEEIGHVEELEDRLTPQSTAGSLD